MVENSYQNSTIARILEAIINEGTFEGESHSNIADILLSILNHTEYTKEPKSVIADLLLRVKKKIEGDPYEAYDGPYVSRIAEILLSILNETEYTEAPQSRIAELLLELKEELEAYTELTASGSIASFITNVVKPLVNGEFTIQAYQEGSGDPSPVNVRNIIPFNAQKITKSRSKNLFDEVYPDISGTIKYRPIFIGNGVFTGSSNITSNMVYLFGGIVSEGASPTSVIRSDRTQTVTAINEYITIAYRTLSGDSPSNYHVQIERGSTATAYEPYVTPTIYTKQLGETVYGGSYNSVTGKLILQWKLRTITNESVNIGSISYIKSDACDGFVFDNDIDSSITYYDKVTSNYLKKADLNTNIWSRVGYPNYFVFNGTQIHFNISNDLLGITDYTTETIESVRAKLKSYIDNNPLKVLCPLKTPIETDIGATPIETYDGDNNIFCDTGNTSVTYLYKGTPPETLNRLLSKGSSENNDIMKEEIEEIKTEDEKPINEEEEVEENER